MVQFKKAVSPIFLYYNNKHTKLVSSLEIIEITVYNWPSVEKQFQGKHKGKDPQDNSTHQICNTDEVVLSSRPFYGRQFEELLSVELVHRKVWY